MPASPKNLRHKNVITSESRAPARPPSSLWKCLCVGKDCFLPNPDASQWPSPSPRAASSGQNRGCDCQRTRDTSRGRRRLCGEAAGGGGCVCSLSISIQRRNLCSCISCSWDEQHGEGRSVASGIEGSAGQLAGGAFVMESAEGAAAVMWQVTPKKCIIILHRELGENLPSEQSHFWRNSS